ncbi:MAG: hypothetical protein PVG83_10010 [Acidimicrobiia bacterium]|jgi:hypothetical protein
MLWFEPLPWGRWALAILIALGALYVEFAPDPTVDLPFAVADIAPGEPIDGTNTEMRTVPAGLLDGATFGDVAKSEVTAGEPVLSSDVGAAGEVAPPGWWVVAVALPEGAAPGDSVRVVLLDSGLEVDGVVAHLGSDDPFAAADGGVAVPPDHSAEVALAAANGRIALLISTS